MERYRKGRHGYELKESERGGVTPLWLASFSQGFIVIGGPCLRRMGESPPVSWLNVIAWPCIDGCVSRDQVCSL